MGLESATYISQLVSTNPTSTDPKSQGDDHLRLIKSTLQNTFPNVTNAITATQDELNILDGATLSTAELNILDGVTASTAEINILDGVTATTAEINYVDGVTSNIQTQLNAKADINGEIYSGTHNFTSATTLVETKTYGTSGNFAASVEYVNQASFQSVLPAQTGNAYKFLHTDGTTASWQNVSGADLYLFNNGIV